MTNDIVQTWLDRTLWAAIAWNTAAVAGFFFTGLAILYLSFWFSYGVIWFLAHSFFPLAHHTILLIDAIFMTLVVIVGARQNWDDLEPIQREVRLARDMDVTLTPYSRYGVSYNTDAMKAGAFQIRSAAVLINYVLCGGVKLVLGSFAKVRLLKRLKAIDKNGCARVIALLLKTPRRHSFQEIVENLPGLNPVTTFDDLRHIEGVLFLSGEPAGLTLLPELRADLTGRASVPS